ncbi:SCO family protein [Jeotgalibacillus sp. R-1-5s-1]|uniref:SCO family protein n=1 Tax=Jeotgalibacillus sp. R-1-5s-1 TaxID=2555897 RepID=UPI00106BF8DF|nr:SCO family protein [Jeotgalibacillus sp. R-1-5s-1]TFD93635.1 SCO family protein [Jeotgalibacillus sp. R-1-5s-1]
MKKWITACLAVLILQGCSSRVDLDEHFSLNGEVSDLQAVNQDGEDFHTDDLEGEIWLAAFIFTNCDTVCMPMTYNMAELQSQLDEKDLDYRFVSFSIDPEHDKPDVLKEYGSQQDADFSNWDFVTGYEQEEIELFANRGFIAPAAKLEGSDQFVHSTSLYLMIGDRILEKYEMSVDVPYEEIVEAVELVHGY